MGGYKVWQYGEEAWRDLSLVRLRSERDGSLGMEGDDSDVDRRQPGYDKKARSAQGINQ